MRKTIVLLASLSILLTSCATIQSKMGGVVLKLMTKKEADFGNMAVIGQYQTNIYSPEIGITTLGTEDWVEGENLVGVQLVKPEGSIGLINFDGVITVDGKEAKSYGGGAYLARFDANDTSPKKVTMTSSNGEMTEFSITASPKITIKSINGSSENATIDVTAPLEIELGYNADAEGKRVIVSLITNAVDAKGFANFQSTIIKNKIIIPADAFNHKHIAGPGPTGKDVTNWAVGENHLLVSLVGYERNDVSLPFPYFRKNLTSFDSKAVTVTGNADGRAYVRVTGKSQEENGEFGYEASSSNAWYARPLSSNIGRIGIASLSVSGTLYKQETSTSEKDEYMSGYAGYGRYNVITTTTTTFEFPKLDDRYWNQFLESLYTDITSTLKNEYGASIVDVDEITSSPVYAEFYTPEDVNNKEYIAKNLRDTKRLMATSLGEILSDRTTALIADESSMPRLLRDKNLDAVMSIIINYQVAADNDGKIVLLPNISYKIDGFTQAYNGTSSTWLQGNIRGPGVSFSKDEFSDLNALNRIGQKDVIVKLILQSLRDLTEEQQKFGYQTIWDTALKHD